MVCERMDSIWTWSTATVNFDQNFQLRQVRVPKFLRHNFLDCEIWDRLTENHMIKCPRAFSGH